MAVTRAGDELELAFSEWTTNFVLFWTARMILTSRRFMVSNDEDNLAWLAAMTSLKNQLEPQYSRVARRYLEGLSYLDTGDRLNIVTPRISTPQDKFVASLMMAGPQSLTKKSKQLAVPVSQIPREAREASIRSATQRGLQTALSGPREEMEAIIANDPNALGSMRVTSPGACDFCVMLSQNIYKVGTRFKSHGTTCNCNNRPFYDGSHLNKKMAKRVQKWEEKKKRDEQELDEVEDSLDLKFAGDEYVPYAPKGVSKIEADRVLNSFDATLDRF